MEKINKIKSGFNSKLLTFILLIHSFDFGFKYDQDVFSCDSLINNSVYMQFCVDISPHHLRFSFFPTTNMPHFYTNFLHAHKKNRCSG